MEPTHNHVVIWLKCPYYKLAYDVIQKGGSLLDEGFSWCVENVRMSSPVTSDDRKIDNSSQRSKRDDYG